MTMKIFKLLVRMLIKITKKNQKMEKKKRLGLLSKAGPHLKLEKFAPRKLKVSPKTRIYLLDYWNLGLFQYVPFSVSVFFHISSELYFSRNAFTKKKLTTIM